MRCTGIQTRTMHSRCQKPRLRLILLPLLSVVRETNENNVIELSRCGLQYDSAMESTNIRTLSVLMCAQMLLEMHASQTWAYSIRPMQMCALNMRHDSLTLIYRRSGHNNLNASKRLRLRFNGPFHAYLKSEIPPALSSATMFSLLPFSSTSNQVFL